MGTRSAVGSALATNAEDSGSTLGRDADFDLQYVTPVTRARPPTPSD